MLCERIVQTILVYTIFTESYASVYATKYVCAVKHPEEGLSGFTVRVYNFFLFGKHYFMFFSPTACRHYPLSAAEETQLMQRARLVMTPSLPATRKLLSQHYSLPETREARSLSRSKVRGKVYSGGTVPPLTTLPQRQRNTIVV